MTCYLCKIELDNKNKSLEHIIPNALGGKLKSKHILCESCNKNLSKIDSDLCNNLSIFTTYVNPKTDRPTKFQVKAIMDGKEVILRSQMNLSTPFKPQISKDENGRTRIDIEACFMRDSKEEKEFIKNFHKMYNNLAKKQNRKQLNLEQIKEMIDNNSTTKQPTIK